MMNYEIFKEVVKEKFMDYMPEKFKGMELVVEPVEKQSISKISDSDYHMPWRNHHAFIYRRYL